MLFYWQIYDYQKGERDGMSLLSVDEFCQYVGIGKTKAREMLANPCCKYAVRIGSRVFVHKELFDEEVKKSAKFQLTM